MKTAEIEPEPERAYCANCKQVQLLEGYDDAEVRAAMGDVKQCVACGHIVDSERVPRVSRGQTVCEPCFKGQHSECIGPARCTCFRANSLHCPEMGKA